ncbi:MAG: hypothetical protein ACI94Y_004234 [Maribacter sp.]
MWLKNKYGLINSHRKIIIPTKYDYIYDGLVDIQKDEKFGFFDIKNKELAIPLMYKKYSHFSEGLGSCKTQ